MSRPGLRESQHMTEIQKQIALVRTLDLRVAEKHIVEQLCVLIEKDKMWRCYKCESTDLKSIGLCYAQCQNCGTVIN